MYACPFTTIGAVAQVRAPAHGTLIGRFDRASYITAASAFDRAHLWRTGHVGSAIGATIRIASLRSALDAPFRQAARTRNADTRGALRSDALEFS